jgi:hypothetical protein
VGRTSIWSFITRKSEKPLKKKEQMTGVETHTGAFFDNEIKDRGVKWQQVSIVKSIPIE